MVAKVDGLDEMHIAHLELELECEIRYALINPRKHLKTCFHESEYEVDEIGTQDQVMILTTEFVVGLSMQTWSSREEKKIRKYISSKQLPQWEFALA